MYVHVCMYICTYIYIHMLTLCCELDIIYICTYTYVLYMINVCMYIYIYIYIYIYAGRYVYVTTYIYFYIYLFNTSRSSDFISWESCRLWGGFGW